ncbi:hypothetical protein NKH98_29900 [Mesorhizobium sp. M0833]|uniref:hypothetical protein n=1 Tax=Mesorhizobium sp. M0833 TaxID=2957009 RepID=UPI003336B5ED
MTVLAAYDARIDCLSVIFDISVGDYLALVDRAYRNRGGLKNQRSALKTTSARRIRQRMKDDIAAGAVVPPVVIGVTVTDKDFDRLRSEVDSRKLDSGEFFKNLNPDAISIIDGMQRTTAFLEASEENGEVTRRKIRVEFWVSRNENALIYRMLVLNAGQIPWDLKKQISVVFEPLIAAARSHTDASRIIEYGQGRRFNPGEYSANDIAEMYLAFASRKLSIDTEEVLTDEFTKLDIVESLARYDFRRYFFDSLNILIAMDRAFSTFTEPGYAKRKAGREIFDKQAARVGLLVAIAIRSIGRVGTEVNADAATTTVEVINNQATSYCSRFLALTNDEKREFLKLGILNELLDRRVGQVGRFERTLFFEAFKALIEQSFDVRDMEVCWRAQL